ncbi:MAG TPA: NAD-dependent epimerase/dehydratase family protein [Kineosporiaceae bacterium]|nr:NAD-dependent epimerase/dehydratase family protein [Kineosporiaceae bacterium]
MRIVVTGLSGNVGTALLRRLAAEGGHEITGIARRRPSGEPYHLAQWVTLDLAADGAEQRLREAFAGADAVVHLAWGFQPSRVPEYLDKVGIGGTAAVLAAADAAGVAHLVHVSSLGAYSPGPSPDVDTSASGVDESWPTEGIDTLAYSKEKVAAERLLDEYEKNGAGRLLITRMRPALVVQGDAGSGLARYGFPAFLPNSALKLVKVVPLDPSLVIQVVHTDDLADAIARVLERRATGAFNVAADPAITASDIAEALGAKLVPAPRQVLRAAVAASWNLGVQPLDPGWIDLAFAVPLMDSGRARRELGWSPSKDAKTALAEVVAGMTTSRGTSSAPMRPRSVTAELKDLVTRGPISHRRLP